MFFSVKQPLRIAGKDYIPCVCYFLPRFLEYTVEHLQAEGKAAIYDKMVFFQNGKLIEKPAKEAESKCEKCDNNLGKGVCTGNSENGMVDTTGELKCFEKKSKKKKGSSVEEPIPSPEEVADDTEGF
jgi:hypothetical protein